MSQEKESKHDSLVMSQALTEQAMNRSTAEFDTRVEAILKTLRTAGAKAAGKEEKQLIKIDWLGRAAPDPISLQQVMDAPEYANLGKELTFGQQFTNKVAGTVAGAGTAYAVKKGTEAAVDGFTFGLGGSTVGRLGGGIIGSVFGSIVCSAVTAGMDASDREANFEKTMSAMLDQHPGFETYVQALKDVEVEYCKKLLFIFQWYDVNRENGTPVSQSDFNVAIADAFKQFRVELKEAVNETTKVGVLQSIKFFLGIDDAEAAKQYLIGLTAHRCLAESMIQSRDFFHSMMQAKQPSGFWGIVRVFEESALLRRVGYIAGIVAISALIVGAIIGTGGLVGILIAIPAIIVGVSLIGRAINAIGNFFGFNLRLSRSARVQAQQLGNDYLKVGKALRVAERVNKTFDMHYFDGLKALSKKVEKGLVFKEYTECFMGDEKAWESEATSIAPSVPEGENKNKVLQIIAHLQAHAGNVKSELQKGSVKDQLKLVKKMVSNTEKIFKEQPWLRDSSTNLVIKIRLQLLKLCRDATIHKDVRQVLQELYTSEIIGGDASDIEPRVRLDLAQGADYAFAINLALDQSSQCQFRGLGAAWTKMTGEQIAEQKFDWGELDAKGLSRQLKLAAGVVTSLEHTDTAKALVYKMLLLDQMSDLMIRVYNSGSTRHTQNRGVLADFLVTYFRFEPKYAQDFYYYMRGKHTSSTGVVKLFWAMEHANSPVEEILETVADTAEFKGSVDGLPPALGFDFMSVPRLGVDVAFTAQVRARLLQHSRPPISAMNEGYYDWISVRVQRTEQLLGEIKDSNPTRVSEARSLYLMHLLMSAREMIAEINYEGGRDKQNKTKRIELLQARRAISGFLVAHADEMPEDAFLKGELDTYKQYSATPVPSLFQAIVNWLQRAFKILASASASDFKGKPIYENPFKNPKRGKGVADNPILVAQMARKADAAIDEQRAPSATSTLVSLSSQDGAACPLDSPRHVEDAQVQRQTHGLSGLRKFQDAQALEVHLDPDVMAGDCESIDAESGGELGKSQERRLSQ